MKKYIVPVAAMLLIAGTAGAQTTTPKKASHEAMAKKEAVAKKAPAVDKSTASITSTDKNTADSKATAIKRKHHHKKAKPSTKTEG
ncbi:hypothetical protein LZZ85_22825 [Terrimonas sp. NA20]|uniref:Acid-shock protein n=1 Tax=Terrimonas ginsenosidimutans TaxID=2908004 RepID=A0ABS9KXW9_9BACT|nr:hypothetical protein [Terrimonas ginsenosidimutans]MCG2617148.1 hypothetical protein [Terrimonas ginsenosidimutans]